MTPLDSIIARTVPPDPWSEGDNIPWNDPAFSARMLAEHLDQSHDLASRRSEVIAEHVSFIHHQLLQQAPTRILDLGCGPGLYVHRLVQLGHSAVGIDFSPAAIAHARRETPQAEFIEEDLRKAGFPGRFGLIMMLYGQINVFSRPAAAEIIHRAVAALEPGGWLLLEPQTLDHVRKTGKAPPSWTAPSGGLFSPGPHLLLTEAFWSEATRTATERFFVIDAATSAVTRYAMSVEAYTTDELVALLSDLERVAVGSAPKGWPQGEELILATGRQPG